MDPTKKPRVDSGASEENSICFLQNTRHVAHVKSSMRKGHQENKSSFIFETVLPYLSTTS